MTTSTSHPTGNARSAHKATHQRSALVEQNLRVRVPGEGEGQDEVSALALEAFMEVARAHDIEPVDEDAALVHESRAWNLAFRVGMTSDLNGPVPALFVGSRALTFGWERGTEVAADFAELDAVGLVF